MTGPRQSNRGFGLMFGIVFLLLVGIVWILAGAVWYWAVAVAAAFFALAFAAPALLMPLNRLWAAFGARLGWVSNRVVLGLFFFGIMTPTAVVMRLFGWDPMSLGKRQGDGEGYWSEVRRDAAPDTFGDMF